jgi:hypothetical protein
MRIFVKPTARRNRSDRQPELRRVGERVRQHRGDREVLVRRRRRDQDDENSQRLEEDAEDLRAVSEPADDQVESVHCNVEHRGERPASDRPACDQEDGKRDQEHDAARKRGQKVARLRARREQRGRHQNEPR